LVAGARFELATYGYALHHYPLILHCCLYEKDLKKILTFSLDLLTIHSEIFVEKGGPSERILEIHCPLSSQKAEQETHHSSSAACSYVDR
jgi:hypothetical protein